MENKTSFLKKIIKSKLFWIILAIILLIAGYLILKPNSKLKNIITSKVELTNLKQTVLATGQVVSDTDLALSFSASGIVKSIKIKVGDKVKKGDVLAILDQSQVRADLISAQGALAAAKARLEIITEGASVEEINLAQTAVDNAKRDYKNIKTVQETLVNNAYHNLLNSAPEAIPAGGTNDNTSPTISGNYKLGKEGTMNIATYSSGIGTVFTVSGLTSGNGVVTTKTPQPIGDSGLSIIFPSTTNLNSGNWVITIPNKQAPNYLVNYNVYKSALKMEQSALSQAKSLVDRSEAEFAVKTAGARESDIKLAQANILSAQGRVDSAQINLSNTILRSPVTGTITSVNTKIGQRINNLQKVIILQDIDSLHAETNISETNVASLKIGQNVDYTFDALGPDQHFTGKILSIDPAATIISGVVNYLVKTSLINISNIKPGMTINLTIKVASKENVLAVPSSALIQENDKSYLRIIDNPQTKTYHKVLVKTGLEADDGLVQITSGLREGQEIVTYAKS